MILKICWFLLDVDPKRPSETSSSEAQVLTAIAGRDKILTEVFDDNSIPYIKAMSGNGAHALVPLPAYTNDDNTKEKLSLFIKWLAKTYDNNDITVDPLVTNPSQAWKLYGTLACKGDNHPDAHTASLKSTLPIHLNRLICSPSSMRSYQSLNPNGVVTATPHRATPRSTVEKS